MKKCLKFTRMVRTIFENYPIFTGNICKACMRSQEVNDKITPCHHVSPQFVEFLSLKKMFVTKININPSPIPYLYPKRKFNSNCIAIKSF